MRPGRRVFGIQIVCTGELGWTVHGSGAERLGTRDEVRRRQTGASEALGLTGALDIGQRVRRDAHDRS